MAIDEQGRACSATPIARHTAPSGGSLMENWDALDQTEKVILREAAEILARDIASDVEAPDAQQAVRLAVLDDETGALTAAALRETASGGVAFRGTAVLSGATSHAATAHLRECFRAELADGRLRLHGDAVGEASDDPAPTVVPGTPLVVIARLPKSLRGLEARAREALALAGSTPLTLIAGGRTKHMTLRQNETLAALGADVRASRGLGKSRALIARWERGAASRGADAEAPTVQRHQITLPIRGRERPVELRGIGGVFGGAQADAGSLLLWRGFDDALRDGALPELDRCEPRPRVVDLGGGNGTLAAALALALPNAHVIATDDDADAVASTRATLAANSLQDQVEVRWETSAAGIAESSIDAVLLNPPFHDGAGIDATLVQGLLDAAARILRPGGTLWLVHNSHLRYRREVERRVGPTRQAARDRRFTVLRAETPHASGPQH